MPRSTKSYGFSPAIGLLLLQLAAGAVRADLPPLVPRAELFAHVARENPQLSPDGTRLAYLAPGGEGDVLNLWVQTRGKQDDRQITQDRGAGLGGFQWAWDDRHLLYLQDRNGDENLHLWSVDVETGAASDLTPFDGARAQNVRTDPRHPNEVLVGLNRRDPRAFDMYRVDLTTGAVTLDAENPGDVLSWVTDGDFRIRIASAMDPETADTIVRVRDDATSPWRTLLVSPFEETPIFGQMNGGSLVLGFAPGNASIYMASMIGAPTARLVEVDAKTGRTLRVLAEDPRADVAAGLGAGGPHWFVERDPATGAVQVVAFERERIEYRVLDDRMRRDFERFAVARPGTTPAIQSRTRDDRTWLVEFFRADGPDEYALYDRELGQIETLFVTQPDLAKFALATCTPRTIRARDGMELVAYLTLPPGVAPRQLPLVLLVHGGPWFRDSWFFDPEAQWLANRGYAVLQVNFRGSVGLGKQYLNASTGQWGTGSMQHDLTDAVGWAVKEGLADPKRVGIMGGSYGGYATLAGLAFTPELYACGVDVVGPSNVRTLLQSIPEYWKPVKRRWVRRIGDVEHDDALNARISPLENVARMKAPLLVGHGANDPRVKQAESDRIVEALRARGVEVQYVVYPDEGHGFGRWENNLDFYGRAEEFLAKHLGGRAEPWREVPGSSAEVR